jgi:hypothetical protein
MGSSTTSSNSGRRDAPPSEATLASHLGRSKRPQQPQQHLFVADLARPTRPARPIAGPEPGHQDRAAASRHHPCRRRRRATPAVEAQPKLRQEAPPASRRRPCADLGEPPIRRAPHPPAVDDLCSLPSDQGEQHSLPGPPPRLPRADEQVVVVPVARTSLPAPPPEKASTPSHLW